MRIRKIATPGSEIELPLADDSDAPPAVRIWEDSVGRLHVGLEFGGGIKLVLLELVEGATLVDANELAAGIRNHATRVRVVNEYGQSL